MFSCNCSTNSNIGMDYITRKSLVIFGLLLMSDDWECAGVVIVIFLMTSHMFTDEEICVLFSKLGYFKLTLGYFRPLFRLRFNHLSWWWWL